MDYLKWCIDYLCSINKIVKNDSEYTFENFRSLMNIAMPVNLAEEYYVRQDNILKKILSCKQIFDVSECKDGISITKADITLIRADAIVNACNSKNFLDALCQGIIA